MHILQCFLFSITLWSAHTTAFYVWKSEEARDLPGSGGGDVEKREPFYIAGTATTDPGDGELNAPTLQIKRRVPQGSSPHARVERELKHILAKYRPHRLLVEHTSPNPAPAPSKVKRDNKYHVETATPPSQSSSVAVNQDGTDFSYFATVDFGSSNKAMYMLIDTGAANTWVMSGDCTSKACSAHNTFGEADSKTLTKDNTPWHVSYGTGTVKGTIYNDSMSLAGFTVPMSFGAASDTSDDFLDYPMDGILGLGRAGSNELEIPAFMDVLADQKKLTANLFGVNLQRHSDGETDGELNFGSYDKSKFKGDISWIPSSSKVGLWEIPVDDAGVDGNPLGFKGKSAIIDTGTSFILLPGPDAQKLHAKIPSAALKGNTYQLPCSSKVDLQFTFGGVDYTVPAKDYVGSKTGSGDTCLSNIIPQAYSGANDWLLGDTFLKNVYTVFDFDQDRIGFGNKDETTSDSSSSSSSSSASASASKSSSSTASATSSGSSSASATTSPSSSSSTAPPPLIPGPASSQAGPSASSTASSAASTATETPSSATTLFPTGPAITLLLLIPLFVSILL